MKQAIATLRSVSPYSQGRHYQEPKLEKESPDDYERRTWRNRMHTTEDGRVFIPPMALKLALEQAAQFLSVNVPGKGKATWTKHFTAGIMVMDPVVLPIKAADVKPNWLFVPSNGRRGSGKRVNRCFPLIPEWSGEAHFYVLDDSITENVFRYHLEEAGRFIGIGVFRPRNGGFFGRFVVESLLWEDNR
jgi:hypothetical protein